MKNKIVVGIMVAAFALISGCGSTAEKNVRNGAASESVTEAPTEISSVTEDTTEVINETIHQEEERLVANEIVSVDPSAMLSYELLDCAIMIDGVVYQVPFVLNELENNGWEIRDIRGGNVDTSKQILGGQQSDTLHAYKDEHLMNLYVFNPNAEEGSMSNASVWKIEFGTMGGARMNPSIVLPKGIVYDKGITYQQFLEAYGEPTKESTHDEENGAYGGDYFADENDYRKGYVHYWFNEDPLHNIGELTIASCNGIMDL